MAVLALGSVRSCGVTTVATALAATWPEERVLLVELDPAGGTLAGSALWPPEPSLVSLAAAARRGLTAEQVWDHCQHLPGGVAVLAAPALGEQARVAWGMLDALGGVLAGLDTDVLADCGRLAPGSPALGVWRAAERAVLVTRPQLGDLHALSAWLDAQAAESRVGLITMGDGPYSDTEISDALGVEVLARLPWDPDAAGALATVRASDRSLRLTPLVRAARTLADQLTHEHIRPAPGDTESPGTVLKVPPLRIRLLAGWRPKAAVRSSNGSHPEEVGE